jgi:DNA polymerase
MDHEIVGLDFESYFSSKAKFTLKTLPTSEYVRDERFHAHGAALYWQGRTTWVNHKDLPATLAAIPWPEVALLAHNTAFDGFVLSQHYSFVPAYYLDTLSMSRGAFGTFANHDLDAVATRLGLGSKIKETLKQADGLQELPPELEQLMATYAIQDMNLCVQIYQQLVDTYPESELDLIDITLRAFIEPKLHINTELIKQGMAEEQVERERIITASGIDRKVLGSNPQFAELLRARGVEPPVKRSPRTNKSTFAFAKADIAFQTLEHDPRVSELIKARKLVKSTIMETRAARILKHGDPGPLPILMNYCQARSLRWSGGDKMNPQNLPRGSLLRRGIIPPPGYRIVIVDSAQIEARMLAWLAGQDDLLKIFKNKGDPYIAMAEKIFNHPVAKLTPERQLGKTAVLGLGYGMGVDKFAYTVRAGLIAPAMEIDDATAQRAVDTYRASNQAIVALWNDFDTRLQQMLCGHASSFKEILDFESNRVWMPNGLALHFPGLSAKRSGNRLYDFTYQTRDGTTKLYGAKLVENVIQCLARIAFGQQVLQIAKRYFIALLAHDEVVYLAKEAEAEEALAYGVQCLSISPAWCQAAPLFAEGGHADYYAKF